MEEAAGSEDADKRRALREKCEAEAEERLRRDEREKERQAKHSRA
jgi:hypothetical protein